MQRTREPFTASIPTAGSYFCQAVDTDFHPYHQPDMVVSQTGVAPHETKSFTATVRKKQRFSKDQFKVFGRFVRKRFDDFA